MSCCRVRFKASWFRAVFLVQLPTGKTQQTLAANTDMIPTKLPHSGHHCKIWGPKPQSVPKPYTLGTHTFQKQPEPQSFWYNGDPGTATLTTQHMLPLAASSASDSRRRASSSRVLRASWSCSKNTGTSVIIP